MDLVLNFASTHHPLVTGQSALISRGHPLRLQLRGGHLLFFCSFHGAEPEPRAGVRAGHIPGSKNVPFPKVTERTTSSQQACQQCFELWNLQASVSPQCLIYNVPIVAYRALIKYHGSQEYLHELAVRTPLCLVIDLLATD